LPLRQTPVLRYDDSSDGSIDDDDRGGGAPGVVHELVGRCVAAHALKSGGCCGGEVVW